MDSESLDALFSGLTGQDGEPEAKSQSSPNPSKTQSGKRGRKKKETEESDEEKLCTVVRKDVIKKIRIIATREGLPIKDVIGAAFEKAIGSYERKHGPVEGDPRGNIKNLF